jgi:hypothetical protein
MKVGPQMRELGVPASGVEVSNIEQIRSEWCGAIFHSADRKWLPGSYDDRVRSQWAGRRVSSIVAAIDAQT